MTEKELEKTRNRIEARHRVYEGFGEKHTNAQWAKMLGLPRNTLWKYLQRGLTIEEVARIRNTGNPCA